MNANELPQKNPVPVTPAEQRSEPTTSAPDKHNDSEGKLTGYKVASYFKETHLSPEQLDPASYEKGSRNRLRTIPDNSDSATILNKTIKVATFNASLSRESTSTDTTGFDVLKSQMAVSHEKQESLIKQYNVNDGSLDSKNKKLAKHIRQIKNIAEIIQRTTPDILVLAEFDNNGVADDTQAIDDFQTNYLSYPQNETLTAVNYPYRKTIPTNTGKPSGLDLNNDGKTDGPGDAWGYGSFHGQYAYAIFSKYPFDETGYRSFQNFKWKDMRDHDEQVPVILPSKDKRNLNAIKKMNKEIGDSWYSHQAWEHMPLSSKNHIDLPVLIPVTHGSTHPLHLLVSHPAPPIQDPFAAQNRLRNQAEIGFWTDYISGKPYFLDDNDRKRALDKNADFIIVGDLNSDPVVGDKYVTATKTLLDSVHVNTTATTGTHIPTSKGGADHLDSLSEKKKRSGGKRQEKSGDTSCVTSVSRFRLDYVIPSAGLMVQDSGVFWPSKDEPGQHLVDIPQRGNVKDVSSDHRLVWVDIDIPKERTERNR
ncbi:endonuclease/exonuclease/phosphatase family protein [Endozoicomonas sp.]|uniref:endonuclease/exonuclease/phosphatase family protein n=1 Tax=Endozoicomonas sp. TaxID=1892382 RepID=UPI002886418C|nr:endonuclease/exonuclease/phosphatase family protein [Endozoicomonas sp.]